MKVWMDGELRDAAQASVSVFDHGLLYGDGVFEGIRIYSGRIFRAEAHVVRPHNANDVLDVVHDDPGGRGPRRVGRLRIDVAWEEDDVDHAAFGRHGANHLVGHVARVVGESAAPGMRREDRRRQVAPELHSSVQDRQRRRAARQRPQVVAGVC